MKNFTKLFTVLTAACLMIASAAQATTSIGVNFQDPAGGPGGNQGPGGPDAVGGTAGVIPQPNWNDVGPGISGGPVGLIDNTAAATSATVTWTATQTWAAGGNATPNERLLNNFLDAGTGIPATITISALPATIGPYDVYVYIQSDQNGFVGGLPPNGMSDYTISGALAGNGVQTVLRGAPTTPIFTLATATTPGNYIKFSGVNGPSFTLTANANAANFRSPVDGIQIVSLQVPEPSTVTLIVVGLLGLFSAVRRFRRLAPMTSGKL